MDLDFTPHEEEFRRIARAWLEDHVPAAPLASMDTAEGFEQHRQWERLLHEGGWSAVSWPVEYGGQGANLIEWLIFEEEYYRAGAPGRVNQNGIFCWPGMQMSLIVRMSLQGSPFARAARGATRSTPASATAASAVLANGVVQEEDRRACPPFSLPRMRNKIPPGTIPQGSMP